MLVAVLALFAVAFGCRFLINRGITVATPDDQRYAAYASNWRAGSAYRAEVEAFLAKSELEIPPTRYGFFAICALASRGRSTWQQCLGPITWVAACSGAMAAPIAFLITRDPWSSLLVVSSPLSLMLSRRALQDTFSSLFVLLAILSACLGNPWFFGASVAMMLATREAQLLFLPALLVAWHLATKDWLIGSAAALGGVVLAVSGFYLLGGRHLLSVFKKLGQSTDYVRRFQAGMGHRPLVDLVLVSPVTTIAGAVACVWAPKWLIGFVAVALGTHALITPKNVRFLLALEIGLRMLCAWLPSPWNWAILGAGLLSDLRMYFAVGGCKDPVTYNLVVRTGMYTEQSK